MQRFGDRDLVPLYPEFEGTLKQIRKGKKEQTEIEHKSMENVEGCREGEEVDIQSMSGESVPPSTHPMEDLEKALRDYALPPTGIPLAIRQSTIQVKNFELKSITLQLLQNIQLMGLTNEDPNTHISNFLEVCDTVKYNGVSGDAIRWGLFWFSLKDKAKRWLNSEPPDSTSWDILVRQFLSKFSLWKKQQR